MHSSETISGTILVIDTDEHLPRQKAMLEQAGFSVLTASSAKEGLAVAREQHPDLVISEVILEKPDSGFVLGYRMKNDPQLAGTPLVLLSSIFRKTGTVFDLSSPEARRWIKADAYLDAPVEPARLITKVRTLLHELRAANN